MSKKHRIIEPEYWMGSPGLRACSIEARGLMADLACMLDGGYLPAGIAVQSSNGGMVIDFPALARMTAEKEARVSHLVGELFLNGILSVDGSGNTYCPHLAKSDRLRRIRQQAGALGGRARMGLVPQPPEPEVLSAPPGELFPGVIEEDPSACPHRQIVEVYHEVLKDMPRVLMGRWSGSASEKNLRQRWKEGWNSSDPEFTYSTAAEGLEHWRRLFEAVAASSFLTGRATSWKADLHWLLKRDNFTKVLSGRYIDGANGAGRNTSSGGARQFLAPSDFKVQDDSGATGLDKYRGRGQHGMEGGHGQQQG